MTEVRLDDDAIPVCNAPVARVPFLGLGFLVVLIDSLAIFGSCALAVLLHQAISAQSVGVLDIACSLGLAASTIFVLFAKSFGMYRMDALVSSRALLPSTLRAWMATLLALAALLFFLKSTQNYSRGAIVTFSLLAPVVLLGMRRLLAGKVQRWLEGGVVEGTRAILIGAPAELSGFAAADLLRNYGLHELQRFELSAPHSAEAAALDRTVLDQAMELARRSQAEKMLLAIPWSDTERRRAIMQELRNMPLDVALLPDKLISDLVYPAWTQRGEHFMVELSRAPISTLEQAAKRALDIGVAGAGLVLLSPLLLLIAALVAIESPGPVIFRQDRVGFNGRKFPIYKFRTMRVLENGSEIIQAQQGDGRFTSVGAYLRRSSLDELPQLLNVLGGEMSVIGPRPHAVAHDNKFGRDIANYAFRHNVKPGMTGWAQVHGFRGPTPELRLMQGRVELDLWYIANWSFWLDLRILAMTCVEVCRSRNAV